MVKAFIREAVKVSHVEVTTLIVPGENDSEDEMRELSSWVAGLSEEIPLHVTRFFPRYRMKDRPATDISRLMQLVRTAEKHLKYVLPGNI